MIRSFFGALALSGLATLAGCDAFSSGPNFSIVSGSENTVLQPIVEEFCKEKHATCSFKYEGTLDIGLALQSDQGVEQDAVWPASSVWVDMFDTKRRVKDLTSVAQTPVILGVRKSKAEQLGWIGKDVFMKDILAAVNSGSLKFLMTSATQSNSGASAYLAMLSSALGNKPVIEPGDLDIKAVQDTVRSLLAGVARSSGSSGWLADLYTDSADKGTIYDAMWNYEAVIKETNDKLAGMGKEPLYAIYPADGVAMADSPIGFIDTPLGPDAKDAEARERFLTIMRQQATRMSKLIDDLLSLSRIEMRQHVRPTATVDLAVLLREVADGLLGRAAEEAVTISVTTPETPANIAGDRDELYEAFENLIDNAIKYGGSGGKVELELVAVSNRPGYAFAVSIVDHGVGIAAVHVPRLTERFYRVDAESSRKKKGTGLGLAIVKHILNRHRGLMTIRSQPGQGTRVEVLLPR